MRTILFRKKYIYISRAFFNYVIFYTFQDTKGYLKNLSMRKVILYNSKNFNEY